MQKNCQFVFGILIILMLFLSGCTSTSYSIEESSNYTEEEIEEPIQETLQEEEPIEEPQEEPPKEKPYTPPDNCVLLGCPLGTKFVGSKKSDVYHYCSCRWAKKILEENLKCFTSVADAKSQGYRACKVCYPPS